MTSKLNATSGKLNATSGEPDTLTRLGRENPMNRHTRTLLGDVGEQAQIEWLPRLSWA